MFRLSSYRDAIKRYESGVSVPTLGLAQNQFNVHKDGNTKYVGNVDGDGVQWVRVLVVDVNPNMSKLYYKEAYTGNPDDASPPTCWSDDGVLPAANVNEKQCDRCDICERNKWGSKISQTGAQRKQCDDYLKVAIKIPAHSMEDIYLLRIPPASLKNWYAYVAKFDDVPEAAFGRKANLGDFATYVMFVKGKQGIIDFQADHLAENETGEAERVYNAKAADHIIGITNIQEEKPLIEVPAKRAQIEGPNPTNRAPVSQQKTTSRQMSTGNSGVSASPAAQNGPSNASGMKKSSKFVEAEEPEQKVVSGKFGSSNGPNMQGMRMKSQSNPAAQQAPQGIPDTNMPDELKGFLDNVLDM